jgi:hypothetical protein
MNFEQFFMGSAGGLVLTIAAVTMTIDIPILKVLSVILSMMGGIILISYKEEARRL